jgi:hypothetical protein
MDVGKAFTFVFDDENWIVKVLIGGVLSLIPFVGGILVSGYGLELMKNVIQGESKPLPEWDDWGNKLVKGIMYIVIGLVYAAPIVIVALCFGVLMAGVGATGSEDAINAFGSLGGICIGGLSIVYGLLITLVMPAAFGRYLETDDLSAAFRFGEVFALVRDNIGAWLIVLVLTWLAGLLASFGVILCVIGVLFTGVWANLVMMYLWGDAYRQSAAKSLAV